MRTGFGVATVVPRLGRGRRETETKLEPGGLRIAFRTWSKGLLDELNQAWAVDQLHGVIRGELFGREGEGSGADEETLMASGVLDRAEKLLEVGGAHDPPAVILALHDSEQARR